MRPLRDAEIKIIIEKALNGTRKVSSGNRKKCEKTGKMRENGQ